MPKTKRRMINNVDISKSFYMLGCGRDKCYDCKYCRARDTITLASDTLPISINKNFVNLPVAVNLYYGDPFLHETETFRYLERLANSSHKGPIIIITKGNADVKWLRDGTFSGLDLHVAFSTFGMEHEYDKISHRHLLKNLDADIRHKKSIEFRPVCYGINDSYDTIEGVFKLANKYDLPIGYSGLQGKPITVKYWDDNNLKFSPYPEFKFGHKKSISTDVQYIFDELSTEYGVPIFRKTSCLMSYVHGMKRDYNAHYYRPSEMNCFDCVMKDKCFDFKASLSLNKNDIEHLVPFDFEIVHKVAHECILKTKGICEFTTPDCSNISGNIIKIGKKLTTADVRVLKWLTGYTVDADFEESQFLSDEWNEK